MPQSTVWLAAYPRSGVTFLRYCIEKVYKFNTYSVYCEEPDEAATGCDINHGSIQKDYMGGPAFCKTHEMPSDDFPAIHLVRDGRDAMCSQARYEKNHGLDRSGETLRKIVSGRLPRICFGRQSPQLWNWSEHTLAWLRRPNTVLIRYEEMVDNPYNTVTRAVANACPKMLDPDPHVPADPTMTHSSLKDVFKRHQQKKPTFYIHGKPGAYEQEMSPFIEELFWKNHSRAMTALGYKREFAHA